MNKLPEPQRLSSDTGYETAQDPSGPRGSGARPDLANSRFQPAHRRGWQAVGSLQAPQGTGQAVPHLPLGQRCRAELSAQEQSGPGAIAGITVRPGTLPQMKLRLLALA